jgi:hypothetical protein
MRHMPLRFSRGASVPARGIELGVLAPQGHPVIARAIRYNAGRVAVCGAVSKAELEPSARMDLKNR